MHRRGHRGFTLIELMIVVTILGVLASVAIPRYLRSLFRARQAEAYTMLGMGKNQQYAFFATHDCFVPTEVMPVIIPGSTPAAFNSLPSGYTLPCDGTPKSMEDLGMVPAQALVYFQYVCGAQIPVGIGTHEFVCSARGDLDGDGNVVEILYCTDQDNNGVGLPSPATGAACSFPYDPVRVSLGLY